MNVFHLCPCQVGVFIPIQHLADVLVQGLGGCPCLPVPGLKSVSHCLCWLGIPFLGRQSPQSTCGPIVWKSENHAYFQPAVRDGRLVFLVVRPHAAEQQ